MGSWPLITGGKSTAFMAGGQEQCLGSSGDTVSHLPDCCSFIHIGVGCGRVLSTAPPQRKPLSVSDILPGQASHLATCDPERELPLAWPEANPPRVRPEAILGDPIGLGRGRQNERDRAMVEDPPIDCEGVVFGT
jgi:hypothetical protein